VVIRKMGKRDGHEVKWIWGMFNGAGCLRAEADALQALGN
jgi:hypothetical protein